MQKILDKLSDIFSRKGTIKAIAVVLFFSVLGVYYFTSSKEPTANIVDGQVVTSKNEGKTDPRDVEIEETGPAVAFEEKEPVPETEDPQTIDISDETRYINPCTKALGLWLEADGRFVNLTQDEEDWYIIDCNGLADTDPKYAGLYEMRTTVNNVDPIYNVEGEVRYVPYSTIYLDCFATDNGDGTTTIHYLGSSIGVLINDGFVTQEMMDTTIMM